MAIGPGVYFDKYKDNSIDELEKALKESKKYFHSKELKRARREELDRGIDDNDCIANVRTEINVIKDLLKSKKAKLKNRELN